MSDTPAKDKPEPIIPEYPNLIPFKKGKDPRRGITGSGGKGKEHSKTRLKRLLHAMQDLQNPFTGQIEGFTIQEQMDLKQILKALEGDTTAYREILDRIEGKPIQTTDVNQRIEQLNVITVEFIGSDNGSSTTIEAEEEDTSQIPQDV